MSRIVPNEIKRQIDSNNALIEQLRDKGQFVLNPTILKLIQENKELQETCPHEYKDGYCIYCYKYKGEENDA